MPVHYGYIGENFNLMRQSYGIDSFLDIDFFRTNNFLILLEKISFEVLGGYQSRFYNLKIEFHINVGYILLPYIPRQTLLFLLSIFVRISPKSSIIASFCLASMESTVPCMYQMYISCMKYN